MRQPHDVPNSEVPVIPPDRLVALPLPLTDRVDAFIAALPDKYPDRAEFVRLAVQEYLIKHKVPAMSEQEFEAVVTRTVVYHTRVSAASIGEAASVAGDRVRSGDVDGLTVSTDVVSDVWVHRLGDVDRPEGV